MEEPEEEPHQRSRVREDQWSEGLPERCGCEVGRVFVASDDAFEAPEVLCQTELTPELRLLKAHDYRDQNDHPRSPVRSFVQSEQRRLCLTPWPIAGIDASILDRYMGENSVAPQCLSTTHCEKSQAKQPLPCGSLYDSPLYDAVDLSSLDEAPACCFNANLAPVRGFTCT